MQLTYETDRLVLKVLNDSYAFQVLAFLSKNQELFEKYEGEKNENFYTMGYMREMLYAEFNQILKWGSLRYYVYRKENPDQIIGTISLTGFRNRPYQSCNLGYKFDEEFHHQGYAYEALHFLIVHIAPEYHFHRIVAYIELENEASLRLIARLGFTYEGTAREYAWVNGCWKDHRQYSLLCETELV